MKDKVKTNEIYFESKMNFQKERFEIFESKINFNATEFSVDCLEQMKELEIEVRELSKATYISIVRMYQILRCKGPTVTEEEIKTIKKRIHLS
jgi:NACalpha-BTF3-like transcription factor